MYSIIRFIRRDKGDLNSGKNHIIWGYYQNQRANRGDYIFTDAAGEGEKEHRDKTRFDRREPEIGYLFFLKKGNANRIAGKRDSGRLLGIVREGEELLVYLAAFIDIGMEVDFGGLYRGVAEVLLDHPEVL